MLLKDFNTYYYGFFNLLIYSTISIVFVFLAVLLKANGFDNSEIGLFLGVNYIGTFLSPIVFIKYKFNTESVRVFLFMLFLSVLLLAINYNNFWVILLTLFVFGFSRNIIQTYVETSTSKIFEQKYGYIRGVGSFGFLITAFYVGNNFSIELLVNFIYVLAAMYLLLFLTFNFKHKNFEMAPELFKMSLIKNYKYFWTFIFVYHLALGVLFSFLTIYLLDRKYEMDMISNIWNISVVGEILMFFAFNYFRDKLDKYKYVYLSIFMTSLRFLILYVCPESVYIVLIGQLLHMFTFVVFHMSVMGVLGEIMKDNFKMGLKIYFAIGYGISMAIGAYIGGLVYSSDMFLYTLILMLASALLWYVFIKKEGKTQ